jgi:hypothetical protein
MRTCSVSYSPGQANSFQYVVVAKALPERTEFDNEDDQTGNAAVPANRGWDSAVCPTALDIKLSNSCLPFSSHKITQPKQPYLSRLYKLPVWLSQSSKLLEHQ